MTQQQDIVNPTTHSEFEGSKLSEFSLLSESDLTTLIKKMAKKHCTLNPMPTWIILECLDEFAPILTKIVNLSLSLGKVPTKLKHAVIKPLLKNPALRLP